MTDMVAGLVGKRLMYQDLMLGVASLVIEFEQFP